LGGIRGRAGRRRERREVVAARPSSGGLEVRDDRWGPPVSQARREGEDGAAGGVFLWGRWQFGRAPPARGSAGPVERPRPSGKRGSGRLERKKEWAAAGPKAEENYF
jgi:hypothetical protein